MPVKDLVILCCHATYISPKNALGKNPYDERHWRLQCFQRSNGLKRGEHETFIAHARQAVEALRHQPNACLVISGGTTTIPKDTSESRSYLHAIRDCGMISSDDNETWNRIMCEERATDSYQNLLFSILIFNRRYGSWPDTITVITHAFKSDRFLECHANAIRWPIERICVQGINPPFFKSEMKQVVAAEEKTLKLFRQEPHGASGPLLDKRHVRFWSDTTPQAMIDELWKLEIDEQAKYRLSDLLVWKAGLFEQFPHTLPWENPVHDAEGSMTTMRP